MEALLKLLEHKTLTESKKAQVTGIGFGLAALLTMLADVMPQHGDALRALAQQTVPILTIGYVVIQGLCDMVRMVAAAIASKPVAPTNAAPENVVINQPAEDKIGVLLKNLSEDEAVDFFERLKGIAQHRKEEAGQTG